MNLKVKAMYRALWEIDKVLKQPRETSQCYEEQFFRLIKYMRWLKARLGVKEWELHLWDLPNASLKELQEVSRVLMVSEEEEEYYDSKICGSASIRAMFRKFLSIHAIE